MTFRPLSQAIALTQDELLRGVATAILTANEMMAYMDMQLTDRPSIRVNREVDVGGGTWVDCTSTIISQANETEVVQFPMRHVLRQFDVCDDVQNLASAFEDQLALDTRLAGKGLGRTLENAVINGVGTAGQIDIVGWENLVAPAMSQGILGVDVTLEDLDWLWQRVQARSQKMAFVCNAATQRRLIRLIRTEASLDLVELAGTTFRLPGYLGYPILRNDWCQDGDVWLANMDASEEGEGTGLWLNSRIQNPTFDGIFKLDYVGTRFDSINKVYRLGGHFSNVLRSPLALGRITGVIAAPTGPTSGATGATIGVTGVLTGATGATGATTGATGTT